MIGDFTHFFDNLDHAYLKKQWCSLLECERLPKDHYNVLRISRHLVNGNDGLVGYK